MAIESLPQDVKNVLKSSMNINNVLHCVTELIFNSLDANSSAIALRINLNEFHIQIVDNGDGISENNMVLTGLRYMTNKCSSYEELKKKPKYFGFRGEFLSNVFNISERVVITSKSRETDNTCSKVVEHGTIGNVAIVSDRASYGTTVTIDGFLYNLKVRQKHLRPDNEIELLKQLIGSMAVINPDVSFSLRNNATRKIIISSNKTKTVAHTFCNFYKDVKFLDLQKQKVAKNKISIAGLFYKKNLAYRLQFIYVNKRPVFSHKIQKLISNIYSKYDALFTNKDCYPLYVINISCPYSDVEFMSCSSKTVVEFAQWDIVDKCFQKLFGRFLEKNQVYKKNISQNAKPCNDTEHETLQMNGAVKGVPVKRKLNTNSDAEIILKQSKTESFENHINPNVQIINNKVTPNSKIIINQNILLNTNNLQTSQTNKRKSYKEGMKNICSQPKSKKKQKKKKILKTITNSIIYKSKPTEEYCGALVYEHLNRKSSTNKLVLSEHQDDFSYKFNTRNDILPKNNETVFDKHYNTQSLVLNSTDLMENEQYSENTNESYLLNDQSKGKEFIMEMFLRAAQTYPNDTNEIKDIKTFESNNIFEQNNGKPLCNKNTTVTLSMLLTHKTILKSRTKSMETHLLQTNISNIQVENINMLHNPSKKDSANMISKCIQTTFFEKSKVDQFSKFIPYVDNLNFTLNFNQYSNDFRINANKRETIQNYVQPVYKNKYLFGENLYHITDKSSQHESFALNTYYIKQLQFHNQTRKKNINVPDRSKYRTKKGNLKILKSIQEHADFSSFYCHTFKSHANKTFKSHTRNYQIFNYKINKVTAEEKLKKQKKSLINLDLSPIPKDTQRTKIKNKRFVQKIHVSHRSEFKNQGYTKEYLRDNQNQSDVCKFNFSNFFHSKINNNVISSKIQPFNEKNNLNLFQDERLNTENNLLNLSRGERLNAENNFKGSALDYYTLEKNTLFSSNNFPSKVDGFNKLNSTEAKHRQKRKAFALFKKGILNPSFSSKNQKHTNFLNKIHEPDNNLKSFVKEVNCSFLSPQNVNVSKNENSIITANNLNSYENNVLRGSITPFSVTSIVSNNMPIEDIKSKNKSTLNFKESFLASVRNKFYETDLVFKNTSCIKPFLVSNDKYRDNDYTNDSLVSLNNNLKENICASSFNDTIMLNQKPNNETCNNFSHENELTKKCNKSASALEDFEWNKKVYVASAVDHEEYEFIKTSNNENLLVDNILGKTCYIDKRTGMTSSCIPCCKNFNLLKRVDFVPKGMSPILFNIGLPDKSLSFETKKNLKRTIINTYVEEFNINPCESCIKNKKVTELLAKVYQDSVIKFDNLIPLLEKNNYISETFTKEILSKLEVLSQVDQKYIAAIFKEQNILLLFDQHAVDERIRLERLYSDYILKDADNIKLKQKRCKDFILTLPMEDVSFVKSNTKHFNDMGIGLIFQKDSIKISSLPICLLNKFKKNTACDSPCIEKLTDALISEIINNLKNTGVLSSLPKLIQNIMNSEACRAAIKFGDVLQKDNCTYLLHELSKCSLPFQCAHGRPTVTPIIHFSNKVLNEKVQRPSLEKLLICKKMG